MGKLLFAGFLFCIGNAAQAQWAVYDKKVHEELQYINKINKLGTDAVELNKAYKSQLGDAGLTLGDGDNKTVLKGLDTKFDELSDLTDDEKKKYIGTVQDCGDEKLNANHFQACAGLRNLRLQTLKQSQSMLKTLKSRREQIVKLVEKSRELGQGDAPKAGELQRYQFELQAQQALLQTDAMQLEILMDGYKQREKVYETQMAEARRATDTRSPNALLNFGSVPFVKPPN